MFLLLLSYRVPLEQVDPHVAAHMTWLADRYAAGEFLLSGRKEPRTGGVILASTGSRVQAEAIAASDPFVHVGVGTYEVIEFFCTTTAAGLEMLKGL